MGPLDSPETPIRNCKCTPRNNPEERRSRILRGGSQESAGAVEVPAEVLSIWDAAEALVASQHFRRSWMTLAGGVQSKCIVRRGLC
jgi:hypothetical protein